MIEIREKQVLPEVTKYLVHIRKEKLYIRTDLIAKNEVW